MDEDVDFKDYRTGGFLSAGFRLDLERLLATFCETDSLRYQNFCDAWKARNMCYIFAGKLERRVLREFVEEVLAIIMETFLATESIQIRVGAFYTMYAVYSMQNLFPKVQVRMTPSLWETMYVFISDMHNDGHLDIEYIFHKLKFQQAFRAVASVKPVYIERMQHLQQETAAMPLEMEQSVVSDILAPDNISQLSTIHEQYHTIKCHLAGPGAQEPTQSLSMIQNNLVQYITKVVTSHEEWKRSKKTGTWRRNRKGGDSSGATTTTSESEGSDQEYVPAKVKKSVSSDVFNKRAEIREKAYTSSAKRRANQLHRPQSSQSSGDEDKKSENELDSSFEASVMPLSRIRKKPRRKPAQSVDLTNDTTPTATTSAAGTFDMPTLVAEPETNELPDISNTTIKSKRQPKNKSTKVNKKKALKEQKKKESKAKKNKKTKDVDKISGDEAEPEVKSDKEVDLNESFTDLVNDALGSESDGGWQTDLDEEKDS